MGISTSNAGGGVKSEPNVTPMIDVMLVLLIILMVATTALLAGFPAVPPEGVKLMAHPEDANSDQVLGIDRDGQYYLNKMPIRYEDIETRLRQIYDQRTEDKVLYLKADKELDYEKVIDALDIAAKAGVRVTGMISDQSPGTRSTVEGDEPTPVGGT